MNERCLSVVQVAELLGTTVGFPRRLIEERRITYVKVGRHARRIPESAVREFSAVHTIEPRRSRLGVAA